MCKNIEVIIQARMGSARLPGKVMMDLCGKPVLGHIIERVKQAKLVDDIVVVTSTLKGDDVICSYLNEIGVKCFRGDEADVLSRYYYAVKQFPADAIVRITADCPLIDPNIIDEIINCFTNSICKYVSNTVGKRTYPRGLDCEIFTYGLLERAFNEASENYEREHVTPYMYLKQDSILSIENEEDYSYMRWTLDTIEDFQMIQAVYKNFYKGIHDFYMKDVCSFLQSNPEIYQINYNIKQKPMSENIQGKLAVDGGKPIRTTFLNYSRQYIEQGDIDAVSEVLRSDFLTCGPKITEMENKLCQVTGAKYAVAVSNGTAALHIACLAAGISDGDEVIVSPITFAASANCILYCGGKPVFADIDEDSWNISPKSTVQKITSRTKAIIAVDYTGQAVALNELSDICKKHGLLLIEDAAHSIGTRYDGRMVGSIADMTTFSFHPVKTVTAGEGGAVMINDFCLYEKAVQYRTHGITKNVDKLLHIDNGNWYYEQQMLGYNYRISDIQAALLCSQLNKLSEFSKRRKELVALYDKAFEPDKKIILPKEIAQSDTTRHIYVIRLNTELLNADRKKIFEALLAENIGVNVHYIPVYRLPYYENLGYQKGLCPNAEKFYDECITLPLYYSMTNNDAQDVVNAVKKVLNYYKK